MLNPAEKKKKMAKEKCIVTVLDYCKGTVEIYSYPANTKNIEGYIEKKGHKISDVHYMCTNKLDLKIHSELNG